MNYDDDETYESMRWVRKQFGLFRLEQAFLALATLAAQADPDEMIDLKKLPAAGTVTHTMDAMLQVKASDDSSGLVRGYLSTWDLDLGNDIITPGAYTKTIAAASATARRYGSAALWPLLWMHQREEPIGGIVSAVANLIPRVFELSEFLVRRNGTTDVGAYFPHRVTYHPTCHSLRVLHLGDAPQQLLRAVKGIDLAELPNDTGCYGFGGTFAIKNADTSLAMLGDKMRGVLDTGAEVLCSADTSCLMHIGGGLHRLRAGVRTLHLAEILAHTETMTKEA
jgi:hypothetical protein